MIRVMVRSPSPFARAGLENAISADPRFQIVHEQDSSSDSDPDVILLDSSDIGPANLQLDSHASGRSPRFVLLMDELVPSDFAPLIEGGVRATLPRDCSPREIAAALEAAHQDLTTIAPEFLPLLLPSPPADREDAIELEEPLTVREREVLALLAEGAGNKEIAAKLKISENTAKFHVSSILGKLGATTRTEAVTRGYRLGLIFI